jgi:hypothetical protein
VYPLVTVTVNWGDVLVVWKMLVWLTVWLSTTAAIVVATGMVWMVLGVIADTVPLPWLAT